MILQFPIMFIFKTILFLKLYDKGEEKKKYIKNLVQYQNHCVFFIFAFSCYSMYFQAESG